MILKYTGKHDTKLITSKEHAGRKYIFNPTCDVPDDDKKTQEFLLDKDRQGLFVNPKDKAIEKAANIIENNVAKKLSESKFYPSTSFPSCDKCDFVAKNHTGLAVHKKAKHK